jgi:HAD superfamily hydrolase (TIGR01509 family)
VRSFSHKSTLFPFESVSPDHVISEMPPLAALFDCDGVVIDTETQYSEFWKTQNAKYLPEVPDMYLQIKGSTLTQIYDRFFPNGPDLQQKITEELNRFESQMQFPYIKGICGFLEELKANGVKTALVTSSNEIKMSNVYKDHPGFKTFFDVLVTANQVTKSKPDPQCYLKAAEELGVRREDCVVFEDSFAGLDAGRNAKMKVVGVATTNPPDAIEDRCHVVIPDFDNFHIDRLLQVR